MINPSRPFDELSEGAQHEISFIVRSHQSAAGEDYWNAGRTDVMAAILRIAREMTDSPFMGAVHMGYQVIACIPYLDSEYIVTCQKANGDCVTWRTFSTDHHRSYNGGNYFNVARYGDKTRETALRDMCERAALDVYEVV